MRVLILGGGIHGVGVLHDLVSRGWTDILLLEKNTLGSGTSSRSTKLVHGGLRYLQHPRDFPLVHEALRERKRLITLAPDIVHSLEFYFPILKKGGMPSWMVRSGLFLYDFLAGKYALGPHSEKSPEELKQHAPFLDESRFSKVLSFFDGQMDDLALVKRIGASAMALGGTLLEGAKAVKICPVNDGWLCDWISPSGERKTTRAQYIVNSLGPWSNRLLLDSGMVPTHSAVNNKGIHLITRAFSGQRVGCFLQSPDDGRVFFMLPWMGETLIGTTESNFSGNLDRVAATEQEVEYLLERSNRYLKVPLKPADVSTSFAGLRFLPVESDRSLTSTSRSHILGYHNSGNGFLVTIYGGKYTTYRSLAESIGDKITKRYGSYTATQTHLSKSWLTSHESVFSVPNVHSRFMTQNVAEL